MRNAYTIAESWLATKAKGTIVHPSQVAALINGMRLDNRLQVLLRNLARDGKIRLVATCQWEVL